MRAAALALASLALGWSASAAAEPLAAPAEAPAEAAREVVVAMLPLDAADRLAIYGQPVAVELAARFADAGVSLDVVGAGDAVPTRARLVIDGTLRRGDGGVIELRLRVRDPARGVDLDVVTGSAAGPAAMEGAIAELARTLVPRVQRRLDEQTAAAAAAAAARPAPTPVAPVAPVETRPAIGLAVTAPDGALGDVARALRAELTRRSRRWPYAPAEPNGQEFIVEVIVLDVAGTVSGRVPMGRGRAQVRVFRAGAVIFDRVAHTSTLVGARDAAPRMLAGGIARQLVDIGEPHVRRLLGEVAR